MVELLKLEIEGFGKFVQAETYMFMGRYEEAVKIHEERVAKYQIPKHNALGVVYIRSGKVEEGRKILADLETKFDTIPTGWGALKRAQLYAALGDYENALKWYNFEPHHHFIPWVRVESYRYSSDFLDYPGFKELMRRLNLPDPAPFQYNPELDI